MKSWTQFSVYLFGVNTATCTSILQDAPPRPMPIVIVETLGDRLRPNVKYLDYLRPQPLVQPNLQSSSPTFPFLLLSTSQVP